MIGSELFFGSPLTSRVTAFIDAFVALDTATLDRTVRASAKQQHASGQTASKATRLSGAKTEQLQDAVFDRLRPRAEELRAVRAGLPNAATSIAAGICRAILQPRKLDDDEYEALVAPFRDAGIEVPSRSELLAR